MNELEDYVMPESYGATIGKCLTFDELEALLAAERERCAKVADDFNSDCSWLNEEAICERVAAAIRNLPPQTEGGQT